jgi:molecular chaperone DnaJ
MNPYEVLGVSPTANSSEIKKAYRKLAMEHHPDHNGDEEKFKQVSEAYSILSDDRRKAEFDARRDGPPFGFGNPFGGFDPFGPGSPFQEIFSKRRPERKSGDIVFNFKLALDDIKNGSVKMGKYKIDVPCEPCGGEGGKNKQTCFRCKGSGILVRSPAPNVMQQMTCHDCDGRGERFDDICTACRGRGKVVEKKTIKFKIEEVKDGS